MSTDRATSPDILDGDRTMRFFTVQSAERSLPLVKRVVADIVRDFGKLMELRDQRHSLADATPTEATDRMRSDIERLADRLNSLQQELSEIGCELKDWALGLIDFPAIHAGRRVWLCWRPGEEKITHWHEWEEGFSGRRPIGPSFEPART